VRPAPQGRAYREQRHFCHVTILLSTDERIVVKAGKSSVLAPTPAKLTESKGRRRGGAVAAPRARRAAPKAEPKSEAAEEPESEKKPARKPARKKTGGEEK